MVGSQGMARPASAIDVLPEWIDDGQPLKFPAVRQVFTQQSTAAGAAITPAAINDSWKLKRQRGGTTSAPW